MDKSAGNGINEAMTLLEAPLVEANPLELNRLKPERLAGSRQPGLVASISFDVVLFQQIMSNVALS